ncbi:MAG: cell division protein FtsQ/DivIB [Steroidobacteraceae bacterium]|nr:cell division protein FtsQ/DivIB [Steroidobacteraceae bacterium]MCW5572362.1 cell division protein FtsQ/DivIB [Steroidobacteraceae bacterium]
MRLRGRNRRKQSERTWRLPAIAWRRFAATAASLAALGGAVVAVAWALDQPIETIIVEGRFQRVSPLDVEQAVKQRVRGTGLVSVNLGMVGRSLQSIPWLDSASVQRAWPRGLRVHVTEQVAAARWGANGLLNTRGELFISETRHIPPELPQLSGPVGSEHDVATRYLAARGRLMEAGMRLTAMRLDERGAWEFDLDNGITVRLGRRDVDARFERFMAAALPLVTERAGDITYLDMRYSNGYAIGWRTRGVQLATGRVASSDDHPDA